MPFFEHVLILAYSSTFVNSYPTFIRRCQIGVLEGKIAQKTPKKEPKNRLFFGVLVGAGMGSRTPLISLES